MAQSDDDKEAWFAPRRPGYRQSRPVTWQGWAVCIGWGLLMVAAAFLSAISWVAATAIFLVGTVAFIWVIAQKTRGGKD